MYGAACKIVTCKDLDTVDLQTVPLTVVPRYNELFPYSQAEHGFLTGSTTPA